jgi:hypothetical protein
MGLAVIALSFFGLERELRSKHHAVAASHVGGHALTHRGRRTPLWWTPLEPTDPGHGDHHADGTLFGGGLLRWIDEEAALHATLRLGIGEVVTNLRDRRRLLRPPG